MEQPDFANLKKELGGKDRARNTVLLFVIIAFIAIAGYWASVTELDNVTRGNGEITSASQNQLVQAAEGGVIRTRHVEENDVVAEGDLLFEIDPIYAQAELDRTRTRLLALQIREDRLNAEISGKEYVAAADQSAKAPEIVQSETSLYTSRVTQLNAEITILQQQRLQRVQELSKSEIRLKTSVEMAELLNRELAVIEPLVREKIAPETRLLELQRGIQNNIGEQQSAESAILQAKSAISEIELQIENAHQNYRLKSLEEITQIVAEKEQLQQSLPALEDRVSRTVIRAPMDGIINRINFRTSQAYVKQGDVLVEMVPTGDNLVIQAKILPKDISGIRMNDRVLIRLSAYDSAKYGSVDGHVTRISADAISAQGGEQNGSFYMVDVAIDSTVTLKTGEVVDLLPGMTATVDVLSGKRSVLEYFWQPLARVQELALRD
jgi:adhesin transport system membrane fusion protein